MAGGHYRLALSMLIALWSGATLARTIETKQETRIFSSSPLSNGNDLRHTMDYHVVTLSRDGLPLNEFERTAANLGMDPEAVRKVLRQKQPVSVSKPDGRNTTYSLTADGGIEAKTVTIQNPIDNNSEGIEVVSGEEWLPRASLSTYAGQGPYTGLKLRDLVADNTPISGTPRTVTKSHVDDNGRTIVTTSTVFKGTRRVERPVEINRRPTPMTTTPLPPLEDFLKSINSASTKKYKLADYTTTTPRAVVPMADIDLNEFAMRNESDKPKSTYRTISKVITGSGLPSSDELDSNMRDILRKAGITDADVRKAEGDTIVKTRVEPDGRIVKTSYRVRKLPNTEMTPKETEFHERPTPMHYSHKQDGVMFPRTTLQRINPIDEFLARVNLRAAEISSNNGELVKTITDDSGRVLTAVFVLSDVKGDQEFHERSKPVK